jgi:hypothetical protein
MAHNNSRTELLTTVRPDAAFAIKSKGPYPMMQKSRYQKLPQDWHKAATDIAELTLHMGRELPRHTNASSRRAESALTFCLLAHFSSVRLEGD